MSLISKINSLAQAVGAEIKALVSGKANVAHTHTFDDILGKPSVFPVAPPAEADHGSVSGTLSLPAAAPYKHRATLTGATTVTLATPAAAAAPTLRLRWINGTATPAITWPAGMRWVTGTKPTFATAQGAENVVVFDYGSSGWIADGGPL